VTHVHVAAFAVGIVRPAHGSALRLRATADARPGLVQVGPLRAVVVAQAGAQLDVAFALATCGVGVDGGQLAKTGGDGGVGRGHGSGGLGRRHRLRRALGADQVGPDFEPCALTERPAPKLAPARLFQLARLRRVHVPAAGQTLVEVLLADAVGRSEAASVLGGHGLAHTLNGSNLLGDLQANCYASTIAGNPEETSRSLDTPRVETNTERRRRILVALCNEHGGVEAVAQRANLSADSLKQIIKGYRSSHKPTGGGSPSERALGDSAARAIEGAFGLERGWLDNDVEHMIRTPQEMELVAIFRQLDEATRQVVIDSIRDARDGAAKAAEQLRGRVAKPSGGVGGASVLDDLQDVPDTRGRGGKGRRP
jgi:hypothetical protein